MVLMVSIIVLLAEKVQLREKFEIKAIINICLSSIRYKEDIVLLTCMYLTT